MASVAEVYYCEETCILTYTTPTTELRYRVFQIYGQKHIKRIDCFYEPEPDSEVYISNLPRSISFQEIFKYFISCGEIYHMRLLMDFSGSNRGKCFIQFISVLSSRQAICCLNDEFIDENTIKYKICVRMSLNNDQLLLKSIPCWVPEDILRDVLDKQIGDGLREITMKQSKFEQFRNICYCRYDSHQNAVKAHKKAWPYINLLGLMVDVHWAVPELVRKASNAYFSNFPPNMTKLEFFNIVSSILNMQTVIQIGFRNCFGHITFNSIWNMRKALPILRNMLVNGHRLEFSEEPFKINEQIRMIQGFPEVPPLRTTFPPMARPQPQAMQPHHWIPMLPLYPHLQVPRFVQIAPQQHPAHQQQQPQDPQSNFQIRLPFPPPQQILQPSLSPQFGPNYQMFRSPLQMRHSPPAAEPPTKQARFQ